jgi:hypothetical protein
MAQHFPVLHLTEPEEEHPSRDSTSSLHLSSTCEHPCSWGPSQFQGTGKFLPRTISQRPTRRTGLQRENRGPIFACASTVRLPCPHHRKGSAHHKSDRIPNLPIAARPVISTRRSYGALLLLVSLANRRRCRLSVLSERTFTLAGHTQEIDACHLLARTFHPSPAADHNGLRRPPAMDPIQPETLPFGC